MAKVGRNEPCRCGSGRKTKRCCGVLRGPSEDQLARAFVASAAVAAVPLLAGLDDHELRRLWDEVLDLPSRELSLQLPLPELVTPELRDLLAAIADDPDDAGALDEALAELDTPVARATLARAVVALRGRGRVRPRVAAAALVELDSPSRELLRASLDEAAAVAAGAVTTPGGLLVVSELAA